MAEKKLNTRIILKHDTYQNWFNETVPEQGANFVLKNGEIGICSIPGSIDESGQVITKPSTLIKIGDGIHAFKDLNWSHALAADVYNWAKKEKPDYNDLINKPSITIRGEPGTATEGTIKVLNDLDASNHQITQKFTEVPTKSYVDNEIKGKVAGAVQYLGTVSSQEEIDALVPNSKGDFARISTNFGIYHASDLIVNESDKAPWSWSLIHGEMNVWTKNSASADGYVVKGQGQVNKVWKTDANGNPAWSDDADTNTAHIHKAGVGLKVDNEGGISGSEVTYDIDDKVTFIFDCGTSTTTI